MISRFVILLIFSFMYSQNDSVVAGEIKFLIGNVSIERSGNQVSAKISSPLYLNDEIETAALSRCEIKLLDGSIIRLHQNSRFKIDKIQKKEQEERRSFSLFFGQLWVKAKKLFRSDDEFSINTPTAVAAIRGTEFYVQADTTTMQVLVKEGNVDCGNVDMLTDFDTFIDFVKQDTRLYEMWKMKNSAEEFYREDLEEFKLFQQADDEAFRNFLEGKDYDQEEKWIKSVKAGEIIIIIGQSRVTRPFRDQDLERFTQNE